MIMPHGEDKYTRKRVRLSPLRWEREFQRQPDGTFVNYCRTDELPHALRLTLFTDFDELVAIRPRTTARAWWDWEIVTAYNPSVRIPS